MTDKRKPAEDLTDDHVAWVIDGHRRSQRLGLWAKRIVKIAQVVYRVCKWIADSLKWSVPAFLSIYGAHQAGLLKSLTDFYG